MNRLTVTLAATAAIILAPGLALAGPTEDAFLGKLAGTWKGSGKLTGAETGTVACTLTMRQRSDGMNFSAKCDVPEFGQQNFSGIMSYNDAKGRYEARSPSGEITVGSKKGSNVVFEAKMRGIAEGVSVMTVGTARIVVATTARRPGGTGDIKSHIELKR